MNSQSNWSERQATARSGFTLVELLVVIAIIGILVSLLLPAVQSAREAARRMQCQNHLKQISLAVLNYEAAHEVFPINISHYSEGGAAEANGLSWMVGILPMLEQGNVFDKLNLDGNVQAGEGMLNVENRDIVKMAIATYYCPSDTTKGKLKTDVWQLPSSLASTPFATTNYCGVLGPHDLGNASLWGGEPDCHNFTTYGHAACQGTFWRHSFLSPVSIASFRDGTSNTIIIGECLPEYDDFKYWAITNGTWASTHAPINWIPEPNNSWGGWYNQMSFRSRHAGGATFAFGDGHISFVSETIDQDTYRGMSTRDGGEVISPAGL